MCVALKQLLVFNAPLHDFFNAKIHKAVGERRKGKTAAPQGGDPAGKEGYRGGGGMCGFGIGKGSLDLRYIAVGDALQSQC